MSPVSLPHLPTGGKLFPATHPRCIHLLPSSSPLLQVVTSCFRFHGMGLVVVCIVSWSFFEWECFLLTTERKLLNIHYFWLLSVVQNDSVTLKTCTVESKKSFLRSSRLSAWKARSCRTEITLFSGNQDPNVGPWRHWRYIWGRYMSMTVLFRQLCQIHSCSIVELFTRNTMCCSDFLTHASDRSLIIDYQTDRNEILQQLAQASMKIWTILTSTKS